MRAVKARRARRTLELSAIMTRGVIDSECRSIADEGLCARRRETLASKHSGHLVRACGWQRRCAPVPSKRAEIAADPRAGASSRSDSTSQLTVTQYAEGTAVRLARRGSAHEIQAPRRRSDCSCA